MVVVMKEDELGNVLEGKRMSWGVGFGGGFGVLVGGVLLWDRFCFRG